MRSTWSRIPTFTCAFFEGKNTDERGSREYNIGLGERAGLRP